MPLRPDQVEAVNLQLFIVFIGVAGSDEKSATTQPTRIRIMNGQQTRLDWATPYGHGVKISVIGRRMPVGIGFNMTRLQSQVLGSLVIALCLVLLSACADKDNPLVWTEDIVMPDQRVITLKRVQHFDDEDHVAAHSFEFEHPVTKQTIKWQSDPFVAFSLVAVFLVTEELYILVKPTFGRDLERAGCPYPSMFIYRWDGTQWQQIPYKDSPLPEIRNNVTVDPKLHREHIKNSNYRIPANGVIPLTHPEDKFTAGITLQKFPTQIFQCPAQRKVQFN